MDNQRLGPTLRQLVAPAVLSGRDGCWEATLPAGWHFMCRTDERANRMRLMIPIMYIGTNSRSHDNSTSSGNNERAVASLVRRCLEANFHSALDARYCLHEGIVYSAFIHPLSSLSSVLVEDAFAQVVKLADTTGTTYSSTNIVDVGRGAAVASSRNGESGRRTTGAILDSALAEADAAIRPAATSMKQEIEPPDHFLCPITFMLMEDPVSTPSGHDYEKSAILAVIASSGRDPFTRQALQESDLRPSRALKDAIEAWRHDHDPDAA